MAMPLAIVGGSFQHAYHKLEAKMAATKAAADTKQALLKELYAQSKSGDVVKSSDADVVEKFVDEKADVSAHLERCREILDEILEQSKEDSPLVGAKAQLDLLQQSLSTVQW
jgi:hypothetical protein